MRLSRLQIRNFRNLANLDISLSRRTVIVGENQVGKSNLVHALRLLMDPSLPNVERQLKPEDFWDGLSDGSVDWDPMAHGEAIEIAVELADFSDDDLLLAVLGDALIAAEPMRAKLTYKFGPFETGGSGEPKYRWRIFGGTNQNVSIPGDLRGYLHFVFLSALRDVEGDIASWRRSPLRKLLEGAAARTDPDRLREVGESVVKANDLISSLPEIASMVAGMNDKSAEMVGQRNALETALGAAPSDPLALLKGLRVFIDGDAHRPLRSASLGALNVFYLTLVEMGLARQLDEEDIAHVFMAIEEPEAHLHPHMQRTVFRGLLERDREQYSVLVTTHSPHIVSVAPPRSIVVLRDVEGTTEAACASEAQLTTAEWEDIGRYFDATRAELVFANKVILVEGYAEEVLIPKIAVDTGYTLDRLGITVCAIHGTHFESYASFCNALRIPWVVLTDGDRDEEGENSQGDKRRQAIAAKLDDVDVPVFVGNTTFEYDLYNASTRNATTLGEVLMTLVKAPTQAVVSGWPQDPPTYNALMKAINNAGGKGRFAQRLAEKELDAPSYLIEAFERLIT